ncbi:molybdenum cofactor biosynthesis protein MoaE [Geminicoccus roseus]|uniref:molybdenum cofactor biosynthesis protein MoaE n=1 Tax=Geminicoccus roseus TaxID=404900 RepID=UPI00042164E8|nr:molybdenum cofactor biosynthesis protein MoaE [Geminicoccus roseus]
MAVRVQAEPFDLGAEIAELTRGRTEIGGVATFTGLVREFAGGRRLTSMTLEHYPGMTERELERVEAEALDRWPLDASLIVHRYGKMLPGEPIVLVATASAHRQAALESCAFLIDWLKTRATFWKFEEGEDGGLWVEAKEADDEAARKWHLATGGILV